MKVCGSQGRGYITWQTVFNHISVMFQKVISAISPPWDFSMATRSHKTLFRYTYSCLPRLPFRPFPSPFSSLLWTVRSQTLLYCAKSKSSWDLSPKFLSMSTFLYPAPHQVVVCLFVCDRGSLCRIPGWLELLPCAIYAWLYQVFKESTLSRKTL